MSRRLYVVLPALLIGFSISPACNKEAHLPVSGYRQYLISSVRSFMTGMVNGKDSINSANYRANQKRDIEWDRASVLPFSAGLAVVVPVQYEKSLYIQTPGSGAALLGLSELTRLIVFVNSGRPYRYQINTFLPDSSCLSGGQFSGIILTEDWLGNSLLKPYRVLPAAKAADEVDATAVIETCTTIYGYNYSANDPDDGEAWSETTCTTYAMSLSDEGIGLGSGDATAAGGGGSAAMISVLPGTSVIKSIQSYFQCFTNVGGNDHTYMVTVCVDEPDPGTRTPWTASGSGSSGSSSGNNPVDAGHTFLLLTETSGNTTITRNVGFYPAGNVNPVSPVSQGSLNDDETHLYNISGSFTVDNAQFFTILNYISQGNSAGYLYNLNTNNCTTFVINAMSQAGINLPRTIGTWPGGAGNDPGDLGEDLRENNVLGMSLSVSGGSDNSHYNIGQCN